MAPIKVDTRSVAGRGGRFRGEKIGDQAAQKRQENHRWGHKAPRGLRERIHGDTCGPGGGAAQIGDKDRAGRDLASEHRRGGGRRSPRRDAAPRRGENGDLRGGCRKLN